jgi:hypothetical protein
MALLATLKIWLGQFIILKVPGSLIDQAQVIKPRCNEYRRRYAKSPPGFSRTGHRMIPEKTGHG